MKWFVENYVNQINQDNIRVLDVGSYDVCGTYRPLFDKPKYSYTGLDIAPGPNVDVVMHNPYDWKELETDSFDIVISGQTFEHSEFAWITMSEIARVLRKGGLTCIIAPNGFAEHRHPVDCYRYFSDGLTALARYVNLKPLHAHTNAAPPPYNFDWYSFRKSDSMLVAQKTYSGATQYVDLTKYECVPPDLEELRTGFRPMCTRRQKINYFFYTLKHPKRWRDSFKFLKGYFSQFNLY
jgi:SAM-dependent methyltransferase